MDSLRDLISFLKKNNENDLLKELKNILIENRKIFSISEIIEFFIINNFDYFIIIGYIKEI